MLWPLVLQSFLYHQAVTQKCCNNTRSAGTGFSILSPPNTFHNISHSFSVCLWVNPADEEQYDIVDVTEESGYPHPRHIPVLFISTKEVRLRDSPPLQYTVLPNSNETHLCVTWSSSHSLRLYLDGDEIAERISEIKSLNLSGTWATGKQSDRLNNDSAPLKGDLCGVTIWDTVLPSAEIRRVFHLTRITETVIESNYSSQQGNLSTSDGAAPVPAATWSNFTHEGYTSIDSAYCATAKSGHGIRLGSLDPVASKFVILFLVIIGVIISFAGLFMCSEREIAVKRANKRLKGDTDNHSIDNLSSHSVT